MTMKIRTLMAMALPVVALALTPSAAVGQSYTGNWPLTVTQSHRGNGTYCLTLKDDGILGWPHSGEALVVGQNLGPTTLDGTFQLIDGLLMVTILQPGGEQNSALLFIAPAAKGDVGKGVYEQVNGGEEMDSGLLVFGVKGGC